MKVLLFLLVVLTCPAIRPDHPRIFFNKDTWPEVKARAEGPAKEYRDRLISLCDGMTDNPVVSGTESLTKKDGLQADGTWYSAANTPVAAIKEYGRQSAQCALAWRFTGDRKYLEKARKMLVANGKGYEEASNNMRPVSWYSTSRILSLCAYDWIYEGLTPEERTEIILPIVRHVARVQADGGPRITREHVSWPEGEGFYGTASILWFSGLAASGDGICDSIADVHLRKGYDLYERLMKWRNTTAGDDGCLVSQAFNYVILAYPWAHFNFMHSLKSATGMDITRQYPNIGLLPNWIWWNWIRDDECGGIRTHALGDTKHGQNVEEAHDLYEHLVQYMNFYADLDPDIARLAASLMDYCPVKKLDMNFPIYPFILDESLPVGKLTPEELTESPLKARHFENAGQIMMRSGWTDDATYASFQTGAKQLRNHRHFDENAFTIYKYDHLALDTGCRGRQSDLNLKYYYSQSVAHNVVLIQKPDEPLPEHWGISSPEQAAKTNYGGMYPNIFANPKAFETNGIYTYIASDATACYKGKATEAVRQFVFIYPDYFVVYDRVGSREASYAKQWLLHLQNEPEVKGNMIKAETASACLYCQALLPAKAKIQKVGGEGQEFWANGKNWEMSKWAKLAYDKEAEKTGRGPYYGSWRVEISTKKESPSDRFLNVLTACPAEGARPVAASYQEKSGKDGVSLAIPGHKISIFFNRDGEIGGEIIIDGQSRPLTNEVAKQSGFLLNYE